MYSHSPADGSSYLSKTGNHKNALYTQGAESLANSLYKPALSEADEDSYDLVMH
jgi:hypothetical protein